MKQLKCHICNNVVNNILYEFREMMFGFRDKFNYVECSKCKCIQITEIPENMIKFYPQEYYSFSSFGKKYSRYNWRRLFNIIRIEIYLANLPVLKPISLPLWFNRKWLKPYIIKRDSNILDVGCGNGELLYKLYNLGFCKLTGIDPYITEEIKEKNFRVLKGNLMELDEKFDFIMLNHSFEHMKDPKESIQYMARLLNPSGVIMIRVPISDCYAWKKYGVNWVQLDAPRHFFIHSIESISILCESANLKIDSIQYDSTTFQFYGSELYKRDIPLYNSSVFLDNVFTHSDLEFYYQQTIKLNENKEGDQVCFFITQKENT
jgi:SAM-dependent methyltransferase